MRNNVAAEKLRFRVLYRVFLMRVIDLELLAADGDLTRLIGQFMSIFVTISFFTIIPILFGAWYIKSMTARWAVEHFFIETSMTVAGLVAILAWDSAFPDRRDLMVLSPLPVRIGTLFLAKISALFAAPGLAVLSLNIFAGIAWPLAFSAKGVGFFGVLRAWPAYWITMVLASSFFVFVMLTLQGLAANLLPRQLFLRLSAILQSLSLGLLLSLYFLEPAFRTSEALTAPQNQHALAWLPSYWFLGLFNQLNGSLHPALAPLAKRAWIALACAAVGAAASILLAYFRMLPKIVEQPDILLVSRRRGGPPRFRGSLKDAITVFSLRTLLRSRQHRMILSFYLGLGLAIAVGYVKGSVTKPASSKEDWITAFLFISILGMILAVTALRVVAAIPISLRANWIIRVTQIRPALAYQGAVRSSWWILAVAPVLFVLSGATFTGSSAPWLLGHLLAMLLLGLLLVELCLFAFPKIPFTCSYLPGKANLHFVFWACLMIFLALIHKTAVFEASMFHQLRESLLILLGVALTVAALRSLIWLRTKNREELRFEEADEVEIVSLKLN